MIWRRLKIFRLYWVPVAVLFTVFCQALPGVAMDTDQFKECVAEELLQADDQQTVGDLKKICRDKLAASADSDVHKSSPPEVESAESGQESLMARRRRLEAVAEDNPFAITPHRTNYILLASYNTTPNEEPFEIAYPDENGALNHVEIKYQLSLKFPIYKDTFIEGSDLYAAYTNRSFWQAYNDLSAPFRDINHEPEIWLAFDADWTLFGFDNRRNDLGFNHQSNGRSGTLSRSWNRLYVNFLFEKDNLFFNLKPWFRIPEDENNDDNPDIYDYLGYGELTGGGQWHGHTVSFLLRNNLKTTDNRGAFQIDWSFPFRYSKYLRWYFQYFTGYGECLIDYNASSDSIGVGVQLSDWF